MSNQAYNEIYGSRAGSAPMTSAESSTASMLDQMRDRLASLSNEARSIRAQVPYEFGPDVERIQQQMQRLGERLSDLSRGALVPYNAAQRVHERRVKEVRYVTEDDIRVGRAQPNQIIALTGPGDQQRPASGPGQDQWDESAADALVALYESNEVYAASASAPAYARRETTAASARAMQASGNRVTQRPPYAASSAMTGGTQGAPYGCTMDQGLLDQRFADIAARIEHSLAQIRPEAALTSLGNRFDQLEAQLNAVLGQVATRADIEELRAAQVQIDEIASHLGQFRRQMARLEMIDAHLGTLTSQLSDERLTRLFNEGVHVGADVGRLDAIDAQLRMIAVQLSDERLSGLVSRSASRSFDYEDVANAVAQRTAATMADNPHGNAHLREIGEVRGMLESLINERRHNDENNASMLETMQQAIIRVLDRIDSLELTQQQALAAAPPLAPARASAAPAAPAPRAAAPTYDDLVPPTAIVYAQMPGAEVGEASDFLPFDAPASADMHAYRQDAVAEQAPPRVPVYTTAAFNLDEAFSRSRDAEAQSFGEPQPAKRPVEVLRHDFIADAHRAKLKAASKPDLGSIDSNLRAGELSVAAHEPPAKPRRRSIFSFRSQRVAMSILVVLAAIPAAVFFTPRTTVAAIEAARPTAVSAPMAKRDGALPFAPSEAVPALPGDTDARPPATNAPLKQTRGTGGAYEDANAANASMDTASLPDGISLQDAKASGKEIAQLDEQARMAHLSGQLGIAAAKATPASLMEDQILRSSGAVPADAEDAASTGTAMKLPPPMVGPYSLRLAAVKGDASAQFEVASRLAEGKGPDQDLAEAALWYQRSAANGFAIAQFRLGTLYERGLGVKADAQRAKVWYERAAAQGNVKAMHNLAVLVASLGPKPDYKTAATWFSAAADHGLADSQFNLAMLYENGMGIDKDAQQAYKWLILAAKSGDKDAAARRDAVKAKLDAGQIANAEADAEMWRAKPITGMANDGRLAGQAWKDVGRT